MYAIIEDSGTQIKVQAGDVITVDLRELPDNATSITFDRVLALGGEGDITLGQPYVSGAAVEAEIVEHEKKADKIDVIKFRRRKGYRRKNGHRQRHMVVKVGSITS